MNAAHPHSFGAQLKRYRDAAGLTQEELAERAALSPRGLIYLERGARRPYPDTVRRLAAALALAPRDRAVLEAAARHTGDEVTLPAPASSPPHPAIVMPRLVGRARELALLERHLATGGGVTASPPVLMQAGEPGIGKSRLLGEAAQRAVECGWMVLEGGCQRRGGQEPYAPILGALKRYVGGQAPVQLRADLQGCAWLVRLLPELAEGPIEPLPAWDLPPEQERRLMVEAVAHFLANVRGAAGTLLVLDDLQWAGPDALDLLATLVRSASEVPVRVAGAYRDTEVQPQDALSVMLADLAHAGLAVHRTLEPLAAEEAGVLLDGLLLDVGEDRTALRERVLQRAGGVPFFLMSCAQALRLGELEDGGEDAVPWDVAQGVRQRVAALPAPARDVLGVAAVVGRVMQPALLRAVAEQADREMLAALEAACRARLLVEQGADAYAFAHDVIREVVEADLGAARRTLLHRRVAEALEGETGEPPVEALAYHYSRSGVQEKAVLYLEQAGDKAWAQAAYAAAEGYYQGLIDRLDQLGRAVDAARVRGKLGAVLRMMARYDAALDVLERAAEMHRAAGDLESLGRVTAQIGRVHAERATPQEGVELIQPLLELLEARGVTQSLAALYVALAHLFSFSGRYGQALSAAERAAELARAAGADRILVEAELQRGESLYHTGRYNAALAALEEAIPLAEMVGDLASLAEVLSDVSTGCVQRGDFDSARRYAARALEVAERLDDPTLIAEIECSCFYVDAYTGNWDQARAHVERGVAMSRRIGVFWRSAYPLIERGRLCLCEGAWEEASGYLAEGVALAEPSGNLEALREAQYLLAERDLREGRPEAARARLVPLLDRPGLQEHDVTELLPTLAQAHLELGDMGQAAEVVAQAIERARATNECLYLVDGLRVQARVAMRQGRWEEAKRSLEEGLSLTRSMPYPYAEARLLHVYGEMHARKGEPEPARERLEAALAIFRRLGARKDVERVGQAVADLQRPRQGSPT